MRHNVKIITLIMTNTLTKKSYLKLFLILLIIISFNLLFFFVDPSQITEFIGVKNSYLVVFLLAAVGGISSFTGTAYFATLVTFGAGGSIPWLLGLIGGLGVFISDSIFFFLASHGRKAIPDNWSNFLYKIEEKIKKYPHWMILILVYLYVSFSPFPNDLLMLVLALASYRYKQIWLVLLAGSLTVSILVAYFGHVVW